jgi:hypothetical protein
MHKKIAKLPIAYYLGALLLMMALSPFIEVFKHGVLAESLLMCVVLLSAVLGMDARRSRTLVGIVLAAPAIIGRWMNYWYPGFVPPEIVFGCGILFIAYIVWNLILFILRSPRVDSEVLCAGIAGYITLGWLWALIYVLVDRLIPGAFGFGSGDLQMMKGFNSIYFSFSTISTMGYGDIVPVASVARMLAVMEAMAGVFYMTILIARLVALYSTGNSDSRVKTGKSLNSGDSGKVVCKSNQ